MTRHYIENDNGEPVRGENGGRLFWSDSDGDQKDDQKVYESSTNSVLPGNHKTDDKYDPSTGKFK